MTTIPDDIRAKAVALHDRINTQKDIDPADLIAEALYAERKQCAAIASAFINATYHGRSQTP